MRINADKLDEIEFKYKNGQLGKMECRNLRNEVIISTLNILKRDLYTNLNLPSHLTEQAI
jgi:hypothetical protein